MKGDELRGAVDVVMPPWVGWPSRRFLEVDAFMLHISCDLCGKELQPGTSRRYVVKMEVFAAHDPAEITDADLDDDHLEEVGQLLREQADDDPPATDGAPAYKRIRYDLCCGCHQKFLRDPLSKEAVQKFDFSEN
jgi:hypothetical protein